MFYIADLHTHSRYARATSPNLGLDTLYQWAQAKGIHLVSTGDFTHPAWFSELQERLIPEGNGFFRLADPPATPALPGLQVADIPVRFCLSTEISCVYHFDGKTRKNHHLVYAPDFETVRQINQQLARYGDLAADGRPTVSLSSRDLLELLLTISPQAYLVPAHAWTPWFSTLGSRGGYDSVEACFRDLAPHIFALETGLSSDPAMNRRCSQLDRYTMLSSSDAHSAQKLGREANLFHTEFSYPALFAAIQTGQGFEGTYEFFPEEGKYSYDGHRQCGICLAPADTLQQGNACPVCGRPLTIGVMHRLELLADRPDNASPIPSGFHYIIPLPEILSELENAGVDTKKVTQQYTRVVSRFGSEFTLLKQTPVADIRRFHPLLGEAIHRMREGQVIRQPGYDGVFGSIRLFKEGEKQAFTQAQVSLF